MNDITTFIFDVDGVLTDNSVFVTTEILRTMNIDGYAMKAVSGYNVCVISGEVRRRSHGLRNLGVTDIHLGLLIK
jgi:3-deoxy-D-manno-octulosonate 8-phosphate phosphatase (KDO 8-P phosphatase)